MDELQTARRAFAEGLRKEKALRTDAVVEAFATVPRERFLGPPPWKIWHPERLLSGDGVIPYVASDDPKALCADVLVALDAERGINNGQPSLWAIIYDGIDATPGERIVHIGCGAGYYTAILAELAGPGGSVVGMDVDPDLLARARPALADRSNVTVVDRNGARYSEGPADIIIVNAGITHPLSIWLDALKPGGRLIVPLTFDAYRPGAGAGAFFRITKIDGAYSARVICPTGIIHFIGARDPIAEERLKRAWAKDQSALASVASLRRDSHDEEATCWLHGDGYCLSTRPPAPIS